MIKQTLWRQTALIRHQQGTTLFEALVAMFVLAFGVLALMVAQLRSVSSVQEAENQTIVAQAAQTLMEGMLVNPRLSLTASDLTVKDYDLYAQGNVANYCSAGGEADYGAATLNKEALAKVQLCQFSRELQTKLPNIGQLDARVCKGSLKTGNCNANEAGYIITVAWNVQTGIDAPDAQNSAEPQGAMRYRYVLPLQD